MSRAAALLAALALSAASAGAQVAPDARWRSFSTPRFHIHFTPELEPVARRAAFFAERAYDRLSEQLTPPRGPIDMVVSDDVDLSNGMATPFPSNRIIIYAAPPVEVSALSARDDWIDLVVTHELVHIFHLDRSRGIWRAAQTLFGRAPFLFPAAYSPSWLTEGLAVYYESVLTGAGRLDGTHHRMIARAAAVDHRIPRIDQWSIATPVFPGGNTAYVYGSLFVEYLARTRGAERIPELIEVGAGQLIPFWLDRQARRALDVPFSAAWREWRDSLAAAAAAETVAPPIRGWTVLSSGNFVAGYPRWWDDGSIVYSGAAPRELLGAWRVDLDGERTMLGRVNSSTPNVRTADGARVFAQHDLMDPYRYRSDLYVERDGVVTRLTHGERLLEPDVREDGLIVATQLVPGSSRLVLIRPGVPGIRPITPTEHGEQWVSPRFSPDGMRIAAIVHGGAGYSRIGFVTLDGEPMGGALEARHVISGLSWSRDGRSLLVSADFEGRPELYIVPAGENLPVRRISRTARGMFNPELSPDGSRIGAVQFTADGFEVGVADLGRTGAIGEPVPAPVQTGSRFTDATPIGSPARAYSPWRTLLPRYWIPMIASENGATSLGAFSSGRDVIGRHEWAADALVPTTDIGATWGATYRYTGLGVPWLEFSAAQSWATPRAVVSEGAVVGEFRRRSREATLAATYLRPRVRSATSLSAGASVRVRDFETRPRDLIDRLNPRIRSDSIVPRLFASASYSNTRRAVHAISPEEGFTIFGLVNQRWNRRWIGSGDAATEERIVTHTLVGAATGYMPLELPGFSRHVLAGRISGGIADSRGSDVLEVGGVSGTPLALLPGYTLGEGRRTFPVRGFPEGGVAGWRAVAASVEYRAPLVIAARGIRLLPFFLDRTSLALFADGAAVSCDARTMFGCGDADGGRGRIWLSSLGAELNVDVAVFSWDLPYRLRGGVALPVSGRADAGASNVTAYFAAGLAF